MDRKYLFIFDSFLLPFLRGSALRGDSSNNSRAWIIYDVRLLSLIHEPLFTIDCIFASDTKTVREKRRRPVSASPSLQVSFGAGKKP